MSRFFGKGKMKQIVLLIVVIAFSIPVEAQEETTETQFQSRLGVEVDYSPLKNLSLSVNPEARYTNAATVGKYLIESKVAYTFFNFIQPAFIYRYTYRTKEDSDAKKYSSYGGHLVFKGKYQRFKGSFRMRYIYAKEVEQEEEENTLRYRAKLKYGKKKALLTPYVAFELFQNLDENMITKYRYAVGVDIRVTKHHEIGVSYKLDQYKQESVNRSILQIGYTFSIN